MFSVGEVLARIIRSVNTLVESVIHSEEVKGAGKGKENVVFSRANTRLKHPEGWKACRLHPCATLCCAHGKPDPGDWPDARGGEALFRRGRLLRCERFWGGWSDCVFVAGE